jgi:hypothetical protein
VVTISAMQQAGIARVTWSVSKVWSSGDRPVRAKDVIVKASYPLELNVPQLTRLVGKMAEYSLRRANHRGALPPALEWAEHPGLVAPVPPSGGEGGEEQPCPYCGRSADGDHETAALPSSLPPSGAGGGGERSDLLSEVDLSSGVLPGQLELPFSAGG